MRWSQPSLDRSGPERLALFADLRRAIDEGLLDAHHQPMFDPLSGAVIAAEALVRWRHPTRGPMAPDEFIPIAERSGLIQPLTTLMIERSLSDLGRLRSAGLLRSIAVDLSPRLLLDTGLPCQVASALNAASIPAACLTLEVTENAVMEDPDKALAVPTELSAVGVRLSVDDFGTGHSSLAYLKRLPGDARPAEAVGLRRGSGFPAGKADGVRRAVRLVACGPAPDTGDVGDHGWVNADMLRPCRS